MSQDEFRVTESGAGYSVELYRGGKRYVTFMDGLSKDGAERAVRSLTTLWVKISTPRPMTTLSTSALAIGTGGAWARTTNMDGSY